MEDMTYGKSDIILAINQRGICRLEVKLSPRKKNKKLVTLVGLYMSQTMTWKLM